MIPSEANHHGLRKVISERTIRGPGATAPRPPTTDDPGRGGAATATIRDPARGGAATPDVPHSTAPPVRVRQPEADVRGARLALLKRPEHRQEDRQQSAVEEEEIVLGEPTPVFVAGGADVDALVAEERRPERERRQRRHDVVGAKRGDVAVGATAPRFLGRDVPPVSYRPEGSAGLKAISRRAQSRRRRGRVVYGHNSETKPTVGRVDAAAVTWIVYEADVADLEAQAARRAGIKRHGISTSQPRRRRDSSPEHLGPRTVLVAASTRPRLIITQRPAGTRASASAE